MFALTIFIVVTRTHLRRDRKEDLSMFFMTVFNSYVWIIAYLNYPVLADPKRGKQIEYIEMGQDG